MSFLLLFFFSCSSEKKENEEILNASIPVLKSEKSRKAKLLFDLIEVIPSKESIEIKLLITNKGYDCDIKYIRQEFSLMDNHENIYKPYNAFINGQEQFINDAVINLPKNGKLKSSIQFNGVKLEATNATLHIIGETIRKKTKPFDVQFKKIPLR